MTNLSAVLLRNIKENSHFGILNILKNNFHFGNKILYFILDTVGFIFSIFISLYETIKLYEIFQNENVYNLFNNNVLLLTFINP